VLLDPASPNGADLDGAAQSKPCSTSAAKRAAHSMARGAGGDGIDAHAS
jgi:hypothetical protein